MKKIITIVLVALMGIAFCSFSSTSRPRPKKVIISTEADAKIFLNGKQIDVTSTTIRIPAFGTMVVRVEKVGYITEERNYINDGTHVIPKADYIKLEKDDAYESSLTTDLANRDIDISTNHNEDDSWKLIARIITTNFDVIQISDKATGYMCTAWIVKNFKSGVVRTRLIVKTTSNTPLAYKVKLISEVAPAGTSSSHDESFRSWDRILRSFENFIPELKSRLEK